ncbi:TolC family protein [Sulfurimonas sp.]
MLKKIIYFTVLFFYVPYSQAHVLTFSKAYDLAILNSNDVKAKEYKHLSNEEQINQSKAKLYPQVNLSGYYKKSVYKDGSTPTIIRQGLLNGSVSLSQVIYDKSTYANIDAQKIRAKYFKVDFELSKQQLATDVFEAYLNVLKATNKVASIEADVKYQESLIQMYEKKLKKHLTNKMDLLQVKVQCNSSKIDLSKEKQLLSVYKKQLEQYVGKISYELPLVTMGNNITNVLNEMAKNVALRKESLEILESKINVDASRQSIDTAFAGHLPTVSLNLKYDRYSTDTPTIDAPYQYTEYAMININIPIYSGGYVSSKVQSATLDFHAAQESYQAIKKKKKVEYETNMALFTAAKDSVAMYQLAYKSAQEYVTSIEAGYKYGLKSIVDLNKAKKDLFNVKYNYIDNIYQLVDSYIKLLLINNNFDGVKTLDKIIQNKEY